MDWIERYQKHQIQYWIEVENYFESLPLQVYRQGRLLRNDLAINYSPTGELTDILTRAQDYPPQSLPLMLLDDLGASLGNVRQSAEENLFTGLLFTFCAIYTQNSILDESSFFDHQYLILANALSQEADRRFANLFPGNSPFWDYHRKFWQAHAEAALFDWEEVFTRTHSTEPEDVLSGAHLFAPYKLIPVGAALLSGQPNLIPDLMKIFDYLHAAQSIMQDLDSFPQHLYRGKFTYPVLRTIAQLGTPAGTQINPQGVLMAMALIGIGEKIQADLQNHLEACLSGAAHLGLNNLLKYLDQIQNRSVEVFEQFSSIIKLPQQTESPLAPSQAQKQLIPAAQSSLATAIEMAEAYLLSDLSFEESWEVHRHCLARSHLVTACFPASLILEVLCTNGHNLASQVDAYFKYQRNHNHRYYDHPGLPYADSDNLAALLSLFQFSAEKDLNREILAVPLEWMRNSLTQTGRIPVWLGESPRNQGKFEGTVRLLGEGCGSIETRLLLALIDYDWQRYQEFIQKSAAQLLERFIEHGAGITVNYPRGFCLWKVNHLLGRLSSLPFAGSLKTHIEKAYQLSPELLRNQAARFRITPQDAAFLTLASFNSSSEKTFQRRWLTIMLKNQRSDGSWFGEPLFFVPNRGRHTTWHASHQLTTAFCYHALKTYSNRGEA